MTTKIIKNLRTARAIISDLPSGKLDLGTFKSEGKCGTIACVAGWLSMNPSFEQIMKLMRTGNGLHPWCIAEASAVEVAKLKDGSYDFSWLDEHFGPDAFDNLFGMRFAGLRDREHPSYDEDDDDFAADVTDKDLALWRIDQQINALTEEQDV